MESESRLILVGTVIVAALAGGVYYYHELQRDEPVPPPTGVTAPSELPPPEPEIKYPIQTPATATTKPLPALAESDATLEQALSELADKSALARFFELDSIVRRVIVTLDSLPRKKMPQRYNLAKPVEGKFAITGKDDNLTLSADNYRRYAPMIALLERVDTQKLAALYRRFYPLFQEEYRNIGSPKQYFNDRVVEVIDDLLAAPDPKAPVKLIRPRVFYQFADAELENLSAGQKLMIRLGSDNAARVKAKLQEIRSEITTAR